LVREAVDIYREAAPELHPDRVSADFSLGEVLLYQGRYDAAAELLERVLAARRMLYAPSSIRIADALMTLAQVRVEQQRSGEAEMLLREAIDIARQGRATEPHNVVYPQTTLGRLLLKRGAVAEAERELRQALELSLRTLGETHQYSASCGHYLGEVLLQLGRFQEAADTLRTVSERWRRSGAPAWRAARSENSLAEALYRLGQIDAAKHLLAASYRELKADPQADKEAVEQARQRLARLHPDFLPSN
jgi:tetratricopeptide (TPR) repeat protein